MSWSIQPQVLGVPERAEGSMVVVGGRVIVWVAYVPALARVPAWTGIVVHVSVIVALERRTLALVKVHVSGIAPVRTVNPASVIWKPERRRGDNVCWGENEINHTINSWPENKKNK